MRPGTTVTRDCVYCGAPITRRFTPSQSIPTHMYCNAEHRRLSTAREAGKHQRVKVPVYPLLRDPGWLADALRYRSPRQVAAELGCSDDTVRKAAHRCGITWQRRYTRVPTKASAEEENKRWRLSV